MRLDGVHMYAGCYYTRLILTTVHKELTIMVSTILSKKYL